MKVFVLAAVAVAFIPCQTEGRQASGSEPAAGPGQGDQAVTLIYRREVFTYQGGSRRDPFRQLTGEAGMGPRFDQLSLQGIIYGSGRGESLALLSDSEGRVYRVRVGDRVGDSRVIEIGPMRVVLAVENFGSIRQEVLELPSRGGTR